MKRSRFQPHGALALLPSAFGAELETSRPAAPRTAGAAVIVPVRGPLVAYADPEFDSYEAIEARLRAALATKPRAVVLAIDSPGGTVSGCFETSRRLRALCDAAGVPLLAYVDGVCASAAYALACAAQRIDAAPTAIVGSIGIIDTVPDVTGADEMAGVRFALIASGRRKADGNMHVELSAEARASMQKRVDDLAEVFFAFVARSRAINVQAVRALEGEAFVASAAHRFGLVDGVRSLEQLVASVGAAMPAPASVLPSTPTRAPSPIQASASVPQPKKAIPMPTKPQIRIEPATAAKTQAVAEVTAFAEFLGRQPTQSELAAYLALPPSGVSSTRSPSAATSTRAPTAQASRLSPSAKAELDREMGLAKIEHGVHHVGARMYLGGKPVAKAHDREELARQMLTTGRDMGAHSVGSKLYLGLPPKGAKPAPRRNF